MATTSVYLMKLKLSLIIILLLTSITTFVCIRYYSYVFARDVNGEVVAIDRVTEPTAIVGGSVPNAQVFSFAVGIRIASGEIVTASTEDRQWAIVEKGKCVEAKYFPYPPWHLEKAGTYFGARLLKLHECGK